MRANARAGLPAEGARRLRHITGIIEVIALRKLFTLNLFSSMRTGRYIQMCVAHGYSTARLKAGQVNDSPSSTSGHQLDLASSLIRLAPRWKHCPP